MMQSRQNLSVHGLARRQAMLQTLQQEMQKRHRRRRRNRGLATVAATAVMIGLVLVATDLGPWRASPATQFPSGQLASAGLEALPQPSRRFPGAIAFNRNQVVERYVVARQRPVDEVRFESLSDEDLVELLSQLGKPASIGRINGKATLVPLNRL